MESLNDGMALKQSDVLYPQTVLPTPADIFELAEAAQVEALTTNDIVVGTTIDVAGVYNQLRVTLSLEAAFPRGVMIYYENEESPACMGHSR